MMGAKPVIKVLPEFTFSNQLCNVLIGACNNTCPAFHWSIRTKLIISFLFQQAKKFYLR